MKALEWYFRAAKGGCPEAKATIIHMAKEGNAEAQWYAGIIFRDGLGNEKNIEKAIKWLRKAAEQSHFEARYDLGTLLVNEKKQDEQEAFWRLFKAIKNGHPKALEFICSKADEGNVIAKFYLGLCCCYGVGMKKNKNRAIILFREGAEQGYANAQYNLSTILKQGETEQDKEEAVEWLRKAAEQGHKKAIQELNQT